MALAPLTVLAGPALADPVIGPTLWLTDDGTNRAYHVNLDGSVIQSFQIPREGGTANSSVAIDPTNLTLWGANEKASTPEAPGQLLNYDRQGNPIGTIPAEAFGAVGAEGVAVTVSPDNDTLWVVDSPAGSAISANVFNVRKDGTLISSFPTSRFDPGAAEPQAIAYDAYTGSLWITDRESLMVYNITTNGTLLSSFSTTGGAFAGEPLLDVQGITVESSRVLWLTDRITDKAYRVTKNGSQIISSFAPNDGSNSLGLDNLTGIAFDRPPGHLGAAEEFSVFAQAGSTFKMKDGDRFTGLVGDVGLGPNSRQEFDDGLLTGTLVVDPSADNQSGNDVVVSGGTESRNLSEAAADAAYAALAASVLDPTQTFGKIESSVTITGVSGLNVIAIQVIDLDKEETLTLVGPPDAAFVLNVSGKFKLKDGSSLSVAGGLAADRVLINILGSEDSSIEEGSMVIGTILSPNAKFKIKGAGSTLLGTLVGGNEIKLEDGGRIREAALSAGDLGSADASAILGLPAAKVKINDGGSTVAGDVVLGPLSKQEFGSGSILGSLIVDPDADNSRSNSVVVSGGVIVQSASQAVADAVDGSHGLARLPAEQVLPEIKDTGTIVGHAGLNVIESKKIELEKGEVLTITGGADSVFVFNLDEKIKLKDGASIVLTGGVTADSVIFNVLGDKDSSVESGAVVRGTIISLWAKVTVKDQGSVLYGSAISGNEVVTEKNGRIG